MAVDDGYWAKFWSNQVDPLHSASTPEYYDQMAREMLVLLGDKPIGSVLELACGNGAFYERLGFNRGPYVGVDYSAKMLEVFKAAHPAVQLSAEDARTFVPPEPVDLIFSSGYVQYISVADMDRHLKLSVKSLKPGGRIVHVAVPWDVMRWVYFSATASKKPTPAPRALVSYFLARTGIRPSMGHWHSMATFRRLAADAGLDASFYGSLLFPYRFNVVMVKRDR
jgi:trans-aconitate methyltransferase